MLSGTATWSLDRTASGSTVDERLAEIQSRYGPESIVGQFIDLARPELLGAVERTIERYTAAGIPQPRYG